MKPDFPMNAPAKHPLQLRWILSAFVLAEIVTRLLLLSGGAGFSRVLLRFATFGTSLLLLILLPWRGRRHPAALPLLWVMILLAFELFHPQTNTMLSGLAQFGMYLAILSPLLWVPRLQVRERNLRAALLLLWLFYSLSSAIGVLQMYFPGRFQPPLSPIIASLGPNVQGLMIHLANGQRVFRPMGLTDTPGGAGLAGLWAILFSLGVLLTKSPFWLRMLCFASMSVGIVCVILAQIRSVMVMLLIMLIVLAVALAWRREWMRLLRWMAILSVLAGASISWALSVGGQQALQRLETLGQNYQGQNLYEVDRGQFLRSTFQVDLKKYPFGAGLGRWGMMNYYFGTKTNPRSLPLYVEIQWTAWLFDGGIPLMACYTLAILLAILTMVRIILSERRAGRDLRFWAMIVLAYNIACLADTFDYTFFAGQSGMMFWFLNAVIFTAWLDSRRAPGPAAAPALHALPATPEQQLAWRRWIHP